MANPISVTPDEVIQELQRLDPTKVQLALTTVANKKLQQRVDELEIQLKQALDRLISYDKAEDLSQKMSDARPLQSDQAIKAIK